ncbi:MAG TPA: hypothetical protein VF572_02200 [Candidatus Saccharimonadales bacterium]|jgi:hypothetical protein
MPTASSPKSSVKSSVKPTARQGVREPVNAGLIVLQWLTYAFWGWTVLSLSVLTTMVISHFIADGDTGGFMPYGIAAILVLLPLSYVCDRFYSRQEPAKKVGAEVWVMVVHAVVFALLGIGALITSVISAVLLVTGTTSSDAAKVALFSGLIIFVYYLLTFLRTLNPIRFRPYVWKYPMIMLVSVGVIALVGIAGPLARERSTRDDRLISSEINTVTDAISNYTTRNNALPSSLEALDLKDDARKLVDGGLLEYTPGSEVTPSDLPLYDVEQGPATSHPGASIKQPDFADRSQIESGTTYRYQLCATFAKESKDYSKYSSGGDAPDDEGYLTYVSAYDHPAGRHCYKIKTNTY